MSTFYQNYHFAVAREDHHFAALEIIACAMVKFEQAHSFMGYNDVMARQNLKKEGSELLLIAAERFTDAGKIREARILKGLFEATSEAKGGAAAYKITAQTLQEKGVRWNDRYRI